MMVKNRDLNDICWNLVNKLGLNPGEAGVLERLHKAAAGNKQQGGLDANV